MTDTDSEPGRMTRPLKEPTREDVLDEMEVGRCYVVADLVAAFEDLDPNRWTIRNRLLTLADEGHLERRKHANDNVTYRRLPQTETETETEAAGGDD